MQQILNYILHIDVYLTNFVTNYGVLTYALLFTIIFAETALVIFPFLPGDSLLFAAGALAGHASHALSIQLLFVLLFLASVLGNKVNYTIGRHLGARAFRENGFLFVNKHHLAKAHAYYEKHGGKTIILARFIPIIRSFAPFVAGASHMNSQQFSFYNLVSALLWIGGLLGAGYYLGSIPIISQHFSLVIYGIIIISISPPLLAFAHQTLSKKLKNRQLREKNL